MTIAPIRAAAARHGLVVRGGFVVGDDERLPRVGGAAAEYLLLFGNAGSKMWEVFSRSDEYRDGAPHPLNRWSERVGNEFAAAFAARALFPFGGPPHLPFLRWGKRAEGLQNSELGMLIHPRYGLWHAYRFALAFASPIDLPTTQPAAGICGQCALKPCRGACPVGAFTDAGYDVHACHRHLEANPGGRCMTHGCQARIACPEGAAYRYDAPHAAFHMTAFVRAMRSEEFADATPARIAK